MIEWTVFAEISDKWVEYDVLGKLGNNLQLVIIVSDISAWLMLKNCLSFSFIRLSFCFEKWKQLHTILSIVI